MLYFDSKTTHPDPTDTMANKEGRNLAIEIMHVPSGEIVKFKAFITQFDDQYQTEFNQEQVYGRMDAIQSYRGTTRQINLSWDVPSSSEEEAKVHMSRCSTLMNMLYPVYSKSGTGTGDTDGKVISAPPIFRMKFANLIASTSSGAAGGGVAQNGLFGTISGFSYSPDFDSGFFIFEEEGASDSTVIPQTISLSCTFTVIHTHDLGWEQATNENGAATVQANEMYPYGVAESTKIKKRTKTTSITSAGNKVKKAAEIKSGGILAGGNK